MTLFRVRVLYKQYISPEVRYLLLKALFKTPFWISKWNRNSKNKPKKNRKKTNVRNKRNEYILYSVDVSMLGAVLQATEAG